MKRMQLGKSENENEGGENSSASSSSSLSLRRKTGTEAETKKTNTGESTNFIGNSNSSGEIQVQVEQESRVNEGPINNLPPEMLTKILQCMDTSSLFKTRRVNRSWCAISSGILRNRPETQMSFKFLNDEDFAGGLASGYRNRHLKYFLKCIKESKNCPYSHFTFSNEDLSDPDWNSNPVKLFNHKDFQKFLSYFVSKNPSQNQNQHQNRKLKSLKFRLAVDDVNMFQSLTEKLSDFLLTKIPQVEEFGLDFVDSVAQPNLKLFPIPNSTKTETNTKAKATPIPCKLQLPHLKILCLEIGMISTFTEITRDLVNAAVNLTRIHLSVEKAEDFQFLDSLGKLHLVKEASMELDGEFLSCIRNRPMSASSPAFPFPKLEILSVKMKMGARDQSFWSEAAYFLTNLFDSSKDSLKKLEMQPIGHLPGLQLTTLKNLEHLKISQSYGCRQPIFPPETRTRNVFPAVTYLELDIDSWTHSFPQQTSVPVLPLVKTFVLNESKIEADAISKLALMCPNLTKFQLYRGRYLSPDNNGPYKSPKVNLLQVGRAIWTHMKQLESLELYVDLDLEENNPTAFDSCFTGISPENIERLIEMTEAKQRQELEIWASQPVGSSPEIPEILDIPEILEILELESKLKAEREFPSILDMKDLKKLIIHPCFGSKLLDKKDFYSHKMTWVSQEFAFKLMPQLELMQEEMSE